MKKAALVLSVLASVFVLASCSTNKAADQTTAMNSDSSSQAAPVKHKHHHHHDYKGEAASK